MDDSPYGRMSASITVLDTLGINQYSSTHPGGTTKTSLPVSRAGDIMKFLLCKWIRILKFMSQLFFLSLLFNFSFSPHILQDLTLLPKPVLTLRL